MAQQVQLRRGSTAEHSTFTGAVGEITVDTTKDTVVVHDGALAGGYPLAKESALSDFVPKSGGTMTGAITFNSGQTYPQVPANSKIAAYTLVVEDAGKHISITTGGVTIPSGVFSVGDAISIYNDSGSNQTITQGGSVTLRKAGTADTGNRTLAEYGLATVLCVASDTFVISGGGLS